MGLRLYGPIVAVGGKAVAKTVDIGSDTSVAAVAKSVELRHDRCEIPVNNAAVLDMTGVESMAMGRSRQVIDINQDGAVRVTLAMLPLLRRGREAKRILNIASIMGVRGQPDSIPYSRAKGAIANFTRALAGDLGMAHLPDGSGHEPDDSRSVTADTAGRWRISDILKGSCRV